VKKICSKVFLIFLILFFNYVFNNGNKIFETGTADSEMHLKLSVG
jgi:hypothetical protein